LDCPDALELLDLCGKLGIPVHMPCAIENIRQRHHLDVCRNLDEDEVFYAASKSVAVNLIISNGNTLSFAKKLKPLLNSRSGGVYYDFARLEPLNGSLSALLEAAGEDRVVFGSVAPLQYIEPQLVKLFALNPSSDVKEKIAWRNVSTLLT
jgi:hypothetical protein